MLTEGNKPQKEISLEQRFGRLLKLTIALFLAAFILGLIIPFFVQAGSGLCVLYLYGLGMIAFVAIFSKSCRDFAKDLQLVGSVNKKIDELMDRI